MTIRSYFFSTIILSSLCGSVFSTDIDDEKNQLFVNERMGYQTIQNNVNLSTPTNERAAFHVTNQLNVGIKVGSISLATTGMIFLYFLGEDLFNQLFKTKITGYVLGPLFEIPISCISYETNNQLYLEGKKMFSKSGKEIFESPWKMDNIVSVSSGAVSLFLGFTMSTVSMYYTKSHI